MNAGQPDVEWYLMVYPPCYAGKTRITMVVINRTATGRGLQTLWTFCFAATSLSEDVAVLTSGDNRFQTRVTQPRRNNISVAQFDWVSQRVGHPLNN